LISRWIRCGFEPDSLIGRAITHIAGVAHQIKEKWNYLVHYETYLKKADQQVKVSDRPALRAVAKSIADYLDKKSSLSKQLITIEKEAKQKGVNKSSLPEFEDFYARSLSRDKLASTIIHTDGNPLEKITQSPHVIESLARHSARYERYQAVIDVASQPLEVNSSEKMIAQAAKVDLEKDYIHIVKISDKYNKTSTALYQQIDKFQKTHRQIEFDKMKKEYPVLASYTELSNDHGGISGVEKKQLKNTLLIKARKITGNKALYERLERDFPKFTASVLKRIKHHHSREQGFEH
jgi:hypothetical protein